MLRLTAAAALAAALAGVTACVPATTNDTAATETITPAVLTPTEGLTPKERIRRTIELLEEGNEAQARVELIAYLEKVPRSSLGRDLLLQIDTDPSIFYPAEFREIQLQSGQSLSNLSKRYLGSAYEFHALAKYNGIPRPERVVPGQVIKMPLTPQAIATLEQERDKANVPPIDGVSAADALADDKLLEDELSEIDRQSEEFTDTAPNTSEYDATDATEASQITGSSEALAGEPPAADGVVGEALENAAAIADAVEDREAAIPAPVTAATAATVAKTLPPAAPDVDLDELHRRAINAYRSQDLDAAIELWDEVLAIDPTYESARLYRSQAQALKERLKSLR